MPGGIFINNDVTNYGGVPSAGAGLLANRPAAGVVGRLFIGTDTNIMYRDTGSTWVTIGSSGPSGSGAAGQATFWTGASAISGDNAFFWDNTNKRLGLGTTTPGVRLDIHGTGVIQQLNGTTTNDAFLDFQNAGTSRWRIGNNYNGASPVFAIQNRTNVLYPFFVANNNTVQFGASDFTPISFIGGTYSFINEGGYTIFNLMSCVNADQPTLLQISKTRGLTKNSIVTVNTNDTVGQIAFNPADNSAYKIGSIISCVVQNNVAGASYMPTNLVLNTSNTAGSVASLTLNNTGFNTFINRLNVNNATDNSLFELNNNGNFYTGGLSPTILTVSGNTTMARTATGYYCTATLTLTLPSAASLNNIYWVIAASGVTVTVNRAGSDDILNLAGTSVTSITITSNQRAMFYVGGGTRTFLISQA